MIACWNSWVGVFDQGWRETREGVEMLQGGRWMLWSGAGAALECRSPKGEMGEKRLLQMVATCIRQLNDGGNRWKYAGRSLSP